MFWMLEHLNYSWWTVVIVMVQKCLVSKCEVCFFHIRNIHVHNQKQKKTPKKRTLDVNPDRLSRVLEKSSSSSLSEIHSIEFSWTVHITYTIDSSYLSSFTDVLQTFHGKRQIQMEHGVFNLTKPIIQPALINCFLKIH